LAGIGFELKKLFAKKGFLSQVRAFGYASVICAGPMILGNMLQQCYNIADTFIVGKFIGSGALAAVGAAYTLMTFLTSVSEP